LSRDLQRDARRRRNPTRCCFKGLRAKGVSEAQALLLAADPEQVAALLPGDSLGALAGTAAAIVSSGCAECAVNLAYSN
jgi:hypothetical protein